LRAHRDMRVTIPDSQLRVTFHPRKRSCEETATIEGSRAEIVRALSEVGYRVKSK